MFRSLPEYWLLTPSLLISSVIAIFLFQPSGHRTWATELNSLRIYQQNIDSQMNHAKDLGDHRMSVDDIQLWLESRLPSHLNDHELRNLDPRTDSWGNPYRINRQSNVENRQYLIYSMGEDGVTHSDGYDQDDLRSWDCESAKFYERRDFYNQVLPPACFILILAPILYTVLLAKKRGV